MTHGVKQVPKRAKVKEEIDNPTEPVGAASSAGVSTYAGNMADSTDVGPANPIDNMWKDYKGTTETAPEAPTSDHQTVNIRGHNVNPPPPSPRTKGFQDTLKGGRFR